MDGGAAPHLRGVIPRTFDHVFAFIKGGESGASQFLVRHVFAVLQLLSMEVVQHVNDLS